MVARRVSDNLDRLKAKKDNGRKVGMLKWKPPREYRSLTYNQSGFELKNTSDQTVLSLSKIGEVLIYLHRDIPDNARVKQVTVNQEKAGEWYAILGIETEDDVPETPLWMRLTARIWLVSTWVSSSTLTTPTARWSAVLTSNPSSSASNASNER
jgi:hypothetical protein